MAAKLALDDWWGPDVQYYFDETSGAPGGSDSGWQSSNTYTDTGLTAGQQYTYNVRTRDPSGNESAPSVSRSVIVGADSQAPSPNPMTWATAPYSTSTTSISMIATTATDPSGVEYSFEETSGNTGGSNSGWQNGTSYTDSGLSVSTQYCYRVMARDKSVNQNPTAWSTPPACATTGGIGGNQPPYPTGGVPGSPAAWDPTDIGGESGFPHAVSGGHYMRAIAAVDPEGLGVQYYFTCTTGETPNSGWLNVREWFNTLAPVGTHYCYSVKYRDTSPEQVESASSPTSCVP
jgi:hypothetical protein